MKATYQFAVLLALSSSVTCLSEVTAQEVKLEVPTQQDLTETEAIVEEIYHEELNASALPDERIELASRLLTAAIETDDDTTGQYVLLCMSRDIAATSGGQEIALKAFDELDNDFEIDSLQVKASTLGALVNSVRDRNEQIQLADMLDTLASSAARVDRYTLAREIAARSLTSARKSKDISKTRRSIALVREIAELETEFLQFQSSKADLRTEPNDAASNQKVGTYVCFVNEDWATGVHLLALSQDTALKEIAGLELSAPGQTPTQVALGDELWSLASKHTGLKSEAIQSRARHWYRMAQPNLTGLTLAKIEKRLEEIEPTDANPELPSGTVVAFDFERKRAKRLGDGLVLVDLSGRRIPGKVENGRMIDGVHGTGLAFRGNGCLTFPDNVIPNGDSPRSILMWARIDQLTTRQALFATGEHADGNATYLIVMEGNDAQGRGLKTSIGNPGGRGEPAGNTTVADGKWHHFALTYDGNGKAQLYVDGNLDLTFNRRYATSSPGKAYVGSFIGAHGIVGAIDDFIVFDRAISQEEIRQVKDGGISIQ